VAFFDMDQVLAVVEVDFREYFAPTDTILPVAHNLELEVVPKLECIHFIVFKGQS
jgi:hypothetical protein